MTIIGIIILFLKLKNKSNNEKTNRYLILIFYVVIAINASMIIRTDISALFDKDILVWDIVVSTMFGLGLAVYIFMIVSYPKQIKLDEMKKRQLLFTISITLLVILYMVFNYN